MKLSRKPFRQLLVGLAFLSPNILGFLAFTLGPLVLSLFLAFTNWDLRLHNRFQPGNTLKVVGFDNFFRLFAVPDFWRFLGNTLFLMMGIPFSIAASLGAAMLLSKDLAVRRSALTKVLLTVILVAGLLLMLVAGGSQSAMMVLLLGAAGLILAIGMIGGAKVYRTLFYLPHFSAGVATFILWKRLYNTHNGPINATLRPMLDMAKASVLALPPALVSSGFWLCLGVMAIVFAVTLRKLHRTWTDGDLGHGALVIPLFLLLLPWLTAIGWSKTSSHHGAIQTIATLIILSRIWVVAKNRREFDCSIFEGHGTALLLAAAAMTFQFVLLGLAPVFELAPAMAADPSSFQPPEWLTDYHWAKPAIMLMGFWAAMGSNTMLLYLAALTNIPQELYEASDIDGASRFQKFWNITWPQLAPTTFFVVVMSAIGGLQGGFEMSRVMTKGGPAGATTTLSYFIYNEGFETGRLGYASAVAWTLFLMVLLVTLVNWRFGNRYVNE